MARKWVLMKDTFGVAGESLNYMPLVLLYIYTMDLMDKKWDLQKASRN